MDIQLFLDYFPFFWEFMASPKGALQEFRATGEISKTLLNLLLNFLIVITSFVFALDRWFKATTIEDGWGRFQEHHHLSVRVLVQPVIYTKLLLMGTLVGPLLFVVLLVVTTWGASIVVEALRTLLGVSGTSMPYLGTNPRDTVNAVIAFGSVAVPIPFVLTCLALLLVQRNELLGVGLLTVGTIFTGIFLIVYYPLALNAIHTETSYIRVLGSLGIVGVISILIALAVVAVIAVGIGLAQVSLRR